MKLTAQIRLNPTAEQAAILLETMEAANAACNAISEYAWQTKTFSKFKLQAAIYHDIRQRFALSAQVVVRCLGKVADTYKADKKTVHTFRKRGAVVYDSRILKYFTEREEVSIWTMGGRERIAYSVGEHHARLLAYQQGESDLIYRKGRDGHPSQSRTRVRKAQRARHHSWSFFQLRGFLTYKAILAGVPVVLVDPRNTSRTCHKCGHCEKKNRKSQSEFVCRSCGHSVNADVNGARNIAARGVVNLPMVSRHAA